MAAASWSLLSSLALISSHTAPCASSLLSLSCLPGLFCLSPLLSLPLLSLQFPPLLFTLAPELLKHFHNVHPPPFWVDAVEVVVVVGIRLPKAVSSAASTCLALSGVVTALGTHGNEDRWRHRRPVPN